MDLKPNVKLRRIDYAYGELIHSSLYSTEPLTTSVIDYEQQIMHQE